MLATLMASNDAAICRLSAACNCAELRRIYTLSSWPINRTPC